MNAFLCGGDKGMFIDNVSCRMSKYGETQC